MDPTANLREQRDLVAELHRLDDREQTRPADYERIAQRLADLAAALDGWITAGGFLPDAWELAQKHARHNP